MDGFEVINSSREENGDKKSTPVVVSPKQNTVQRSKGDKAMDILSDHFDSIMKLATNVVEIKKMKVASDAVLAKMAEDRKRILAEAEAYAITKQADTSSVVSKMNLIRGMMQDFYANSDGKISGEDFCKVITEVVNQMGRVENGGK